MKCSRCTERATVHVINITEEGIQDLHFCAECAKETGYCSGRSEYSFEEVVNRLVSDTSAPEDLEDKSTTVCPECGAKESDVLEDNIGCENDFSLFKAAVTKRLILHHRAFAHVGKEKTPTGELARQQQLIAALEKQLSDAVRAENYELAAELRDRIRRGR